MTAPSADARLTFGQGGRSVVGAGEAPWTVGAALSHGVIVDPVARAAGGDPGAVQTARRVVPEVVDVAGTDRLAASGHAGYSGVGAVRVGPVDVPRRIVDRSVVVGRLVYEYKERTTLKMECGRVKHWRSHGS